MAGFVASHRSAPRAQLVLRLKDGSKAAMNGFSFGAERSVNGEVVFNTGMVGYPESLSDPSYRGQILVLTYPLVGNYGVPDRTTLDEFGLPEHFESSAIHATAVIISDYSWEHSHYASRTSLAAWLQENNVVGLYGVDTRALTKRIRDEGVMLGKITFGRDDVGFQDPNERNLVAEVSRKEPTVYGSGDLTIVAVDCGIKNNIIRYLVRQSGVTLKVVPWNHDLASEVCDGVFLSNGPGDPSQVMETVENIKKLLAKEPPIPVFGICMGHQLLALASGAKTGKMPFGNRGMNQPVIDQRTMRCYITPQNHGYEVKADTLQKDWSALFYNANDFTNEGISHRFKPFFSVQFHPEAMGGPTDTAFLFTTFLDRIRTGHSALTTMSPDSSSRDRACLKKVLLLGSGGLSIGQAGEFDYSGSQAIKALKEHGIFVVLVNPNIATVQTSDGMADETYFEPVTPEFVTKVIDRERPDGLLLQFGGQTALNCGIELNKRVNGQPSILERYGVKVLGTPVDTIIATEDRQIFSDKLAEIGEKTAPSETCTNLTDALKAVGRIGGYPVLVRAAFTLGGLGSGFAHDEQEMIALVNKALAGSSQIIIDKDLRGWKEIEYEVVRDRVDNCITVCNMENFDPLGVHTGDSIVVAPSQTLTNDEYYMLRRTAIKVIRHLGVVGECNIQYALNPTSKEFFIIEVNARLSRSSALASKATGYPLAYVAAQLALGKKLTDVMNSVTKTTTACFEPALDYCVVKIPRWDLRKFSRVSTSIGSAMKSVGEVMAIGRKFEEAFQKGMRMVDGSVDGFTDLSGEVPEKKVTDTELKELLRNPTDRRVFAIAVAFDRNFTVDQIHDLSKIDKWFLHKLGNIVDVDSHLKQCAAMGGASINQLDTDLVRLAKQVGFSDKGIARCISSNEMTVRMRRQQLGIFPVTKQIDTLAAEFSASTNYLYLTYNGTENDVVFTQGDLSVLVLGCGAYRIGSSCEFDWCAVSCLRELRKLGIKPIVINYNPETVSTDYDESDRLYFEELSLEVVLDIYNQEKPVGTIVSVGGQIPNNLVVPLAKNGVRILGSSAESIDMCENRNKFSSLCDELGIDQPPFSCFQNGVEAAAWAHKVGYPVVVRPSYVLSGACMRVVDSPKALLECLEQAAAINIEHPVVISKFIEQAKEIEMDAVAENGRVINYAISEHVENAGVHSGDATLVLPGQKLYVETFRRIKIITRKLVQKLNITGPVNIQFLCKDNAIRVIECNLRASRSFPFISKTFNLNFIQLATRAMVGAPVSSVDINLYEKDYCCVKSPMFSFTRLEGADPILRIEMASTGEVACFGEDQHEALLKSMFACGFKLPNRTRNILLSLGPSEAKSAFRKFAGSLVDMGYNLYGTTETHKYLTEDGVKCALVPAREDGGELPVLKMIHERTLDLIINCPGTKDDGGKETDGYHMRRMAVDRGLALITNMKLAQAFVQAIEMLHRQGLDPANLPVKSWKDHVEPGHRIQKREHTLMPSTKRQRITTSMSTPFSPLLAPPAVPPHSHIPFANI